MQKMNLCLCFEVANTILKIDKRNSKIQRFRYSTESNSQLDFEVRFADSNLLRRTYLGGDLIDEVLEKCFCEGFPLALKTSALPKCKIALCGFQPFVNVYNRHFIKPFESCRRQDMFFAKGYFLQIQPQNQVSSRIR